MNACQPAHTWNKLDLFFGLLQAVCLLSGLLQVFIDPAAENLSCVALVAVSSSLVFQYLWRSRAPVDYPMSSLALLGLCVTTQYAALVGQTLGWTSFIELLRWPSTTFSVLAAVQVLAVGAHWVYKNLADTNHLSDLLARHLLKPLGALSAPPVHTLWIMAAAGVYALATGGGTELGDVGGKAVQALNFMAYMPFLILIYHRQYGNAYCNMKIHGPLLLGHVGLLIVVAMALNARQFMAIGPVQTCLIFLVYLLQDPQPIARRTLVRLSALTVAVCIAIVLFGDLAVAMVLNRDKRETLNARELIEETLKTLVDQDKIAQFKRSEIDRAMFNRYDEIYLANPMVARFSETKFHDNNIYQATVINDPERRELWRATFEKTLAILPQPVLDAFDVKLNKNQLMYSFGDFYRYLNEGIYNTLGGFAVGSLWAHLIALFGADWFAVVTVLMFIPTFVVLDSFCRRRVAPDAAPVMMCSTWIVFSYALGGESLVYKIGLYFRDIPQKLMIYLVFYAAVKYGLMLFTRPSMDEAQA
jgi:hypothetical protein